MVCQQRATRVHALSPKPLPHRWCASKSLTSSFSCRIWVSCHVAHAGCWLSQQNPEHSSMSTRKTHVWCSSLSRPVTCVEICVGIRAYQGCAWEAVVGAFEADIIFPVHFPQGHGLVEGADHRNSLCTHYLRVWPTVTRNVERC